MKLNILPTDSLYKFLFIFGLVSMLYCFSYPIDLFFQLHKDVQTNDLEYYTKELRLNKLKLEKEKWQIRNSNNAIIGFQILGILSSITMLLGIYLWYKKEQVFKDRTVLKNFEENIHDETIEVPKNDIIPDNKPTEQNNQENLNQEI